jgi:hypothetical protein
MAFNFDIYSGINDCNDRLDQTNLVETQDDINDPVLSDSFYPRSPESMKIKRGDRSPIIQDMISNLKQDIGADQVNSERVVDTTVDVVGDLNDIDPEVKQILNDNGIFYLSDVPKYIFTIYGPLFTRYGSDESYQRLVESNLDNINYDLYTQETLR